MGGSPCGVVGVAGEGQLEAANLEVQAPCETSGARCVGEAQFLSPAVVIAESEFQPFTQVEFRTDGEVAQQAVPERPGPIGEGVSGQGVNGVVV